MSNNKLFAGYDTKKKLLVTYDIAELVKDRERLEWLLATQSWLAMHQLGTRKEIDKAMTDQEMEKDDVEDRERLEWFLENYAWADLGTREQVDAEIIRMKEEDDVKEA